MNLHGNSVGFAGAEVLARLLLDYDGAGVRELVLTKNHLGERGARAILALLGPARATHGAQLPRLSEHPLLKCKQAFPAPSLRKLVVSRSDVSETWAPAFVEDEDGTVDRQRAIELMRRHSKFRQMIQYGLCPV